ncbi:hypothetical protein BH11BAC7_BH11BAC7_21420 [soil metagenome]
MNEDESKFDKEDLYNRFIVKNGLSVSSPRAISPYIMMVKLKKAIKKATPQEMEEVNNRVFGTNDPLKHFKIDFSSLMMRLELEDDEHVLKSLYVTQREGIVEGIMCILKKKYWNYDQKFLREYFLSPTIMPNLSMDDFE